MQPMEIKEPKLLFWQQTGLAEHPPATPPMIVMGEQSRPTKMLKSERTMPKSPKRAALLADEALWTELQHWIGPVLH